MGEAVLANLLLGVDVDCAHFLLVITCCGSAHKGPILAPQWTKAVLQAWLIQGMCLRLWLHRLEELKLLWCSLSHL